MNKGNVFQMAADDLAVAEVVIVLDQTIVKAIQEVAVNQYEFNGFKMRKVALQRGLIN